MISLDLGGSTVLVTGSTGGIGSAFGSIRVEASIGATTWRTSLFPDAGRASLVLPVKKPVRHAEGLVVGSPCEVTLEILAE